MIVMEYVKCVICDSDHSRKLLSKNSYNITKCKNCGLVYVNPRPTKDELVAIYSSSNITPLDKNSNIKKFRIGLKAIKKFFQKPGKILDVGCSTGTFLSMAEIDGWKTFGVDINERAVKFAREKYGLNIKIGDLETLNFPEGYFDVVTFFDTIEHLPDPVLALMEVKRILKPKGLILITTPNIDGLFPKLTYLLFAKTIGAWEHPTPPGHLYQFSKQTIAKILKKIGLQIIYFKSAEIPLSYTVGKLENAIIDALKQKAKEILPWLQRGGNADLDASPLPNITSEFDSKQISGQLRKVLRLSIRLMCWILGGAVYPVARILEMGDSMLVIAAKDKS